MLLGAFNYRSPHRADHRRRGPRTKNLLSTCYARPGADLGRRMITVHEKIYTSRIKCVPQQVLFSGFGG
jgi:hypothetical protein